jgi:hypothetical protein
VKHVDLSPRSVRPIIEQAICHRLKALSVSFVRYTNLLTVCKSIRKQAKHLLCINNFDRFDLGNLVRA